MTAVLRSCVMADDQDEQTLDLTIEALTGTVYDLCVSPYETILGIKMKIQNLEGKLMFPLYLFNYKQNFRSTNIICIATHTNILYKVGLVLYYSYN